MSEKEGSRDDVPSDEDEWDLPRIVVEDDKIFVFESSADVLSDSENYWVEKNVEVSDGDRDSLADSQDSDNERENGILVSDSVLSDDVGKVLEELVRSSDVELAKEDSRQKGNDDFYKVSSGIGDLYEAGMYDEKSGSGKEDYDGSVELGDIKDFVEGEEEKRGGRSVLEVAGFSDEEAEKKRKEKRERFW